MKLPNTVIEHMSPLEHTVGKRQTLTSAQETMREHRIHHLPVLDGGKLIGIVSARDVAKIGAINDVNPDNTPVEEAMTIDVTKVKSDASIKEVVDQMIDERISSCIVMEGTKPVGIFTTTDALRALNRG